MADKKLEEEGMSSITMGLCNNLKYELTKNEKHHPTINLNNCITAKICMLMEVDDCYIPC